MSRQPHREDGTTVPKILVIEDNPTNLELMTYLLGAFGYETATATDGEAGWEAALNEMPALVICDVHLPRLDGYGVLRRFKSHPRLRAIPVIAVTALAMVGDRDRMLASGFDGYIAKPIEPEEFVAQVRRMLGERHSPLPLAAPRTVPAPARQGEPFTHTILAVDDSPANLQFLEAALAGNGYRIVSASSVLEALRTMDEIVPDLIVADVHMPGLDGFDLIHELKRGDRLEKVPVVLFSAAYDADDAARRALEAGAVRFIQRPIEPAQLADQIRSLLHP